MADAQNPATPQTAADKAAADKLAAEQTRAREEQIKKDQLAQAQQKNSEEIRIVGVAGGPFNITGAGFGASGTLTVGGREIPTTRWDDNSIRGTLPPGVKGAVVLKTSSGERKGTFPSPPR